MADVLRMQLDIQNNLEKEIGKAFHKMKGFNSLLEDSDKIVNKINKGFIAVRNTLASIVPIVGTIFAGTIFLDSIRDVLNMDKAIRQLSHRMGHGAEGVGVLKDAVYDLNRELGLGVENSAEIIKTLTEMRVPLEMMKDMSHTVGMFSELTGMSAEASGELAGNLVRVGRMGQEAVDSIMGGMFAVQRAFGLTGSEMNSLSSSINNSTQMLNQMGKTAGEIQKYNRGVVQLAGAFASVGVEVEGVLKLMDDLLDPGQVEQHAFLLSQLGVSLGDAFEGNIDPAQLVSGFRDLGQTLQGMTGPAAAAMAQQLGMSVRDLRQMGELGENELNKVAQAMADGASGADAMAAAFQAEAGPLDKFQRTMEQIKGFIGEIAEMAIPFIESFVEKIASIDLSAVFERAKEFLKGVVGFISEMPGRAGKLIPLIIAGLAGLFLFLRRRFNSTGEEARDAMETGVAEGIEQGARKGALAMRKEFKSTLKEADLKARTEAGSAFKSMMADAELMEARAKNVGGFFGRVMEKTAGIHRNLAYSTKPISAMEMKAQSMAKTHQQSYVLAQNERKELEGAFATRQAEYDMEAQRFSDRIGYLESRVSLTADESLELLKLTNLRTEMQNKRIQADKNLDAARQAAEGRRIRALRAMSDENLHRIGMERKAEEERLRNAASQSAKNHATSLQETSALNAALEDLNARRGEMPLHEFQKVEKEINAALVEQANIRTQLQSQQEQDLLSANQLKKEFEEINKIAMEDRGMRWIQENSLALKEGGNVLTRASTILTQAGRNIRKSMGDSIANFTEGARNAASAFAERFRRENIEATLRQGARGAARGVGRGAMAAGRGALGGLGGLLKMVGPVAIIAGLLQNIEPVQKLIADVMERVQRVMQRVANFLTPIIEELVETLEPILDTLIDALMPILERVFRALRPLFEAITEGLAPLLDAMMQLLLPLINFLMPPLIWVLGAAVNIIGKLIEGISSLAMFMMELPERITHALPKFLGGGGGEGTFQASAELQENAIYNALDTLGSVGRDLSKAGRAMMDTAFKEVEVDMEGMGLAVEEGTARGNAQSEVRRSWQPAEIRALRDGIAVEQHMEEVLTGGPEERAADSSERTAAAAEQQTESMQRQIELLELEIQRRDEQHAEIMATNQELIRAMQRREGNFGGYSAALR